MSSKIAPLAPLQNLTPSNSKGKSVLAPLGGLSTPTTLDKLDKPKSSGSKSTGKSTADKKKSRKLKMEKLRQTKYATHIQAAWRGSKVRKQKEEFQQSKEKQSATKLILGSYEQSVKNVNLENEKENACPETIIDDKKDAVVVSSDDVAERVDIATYEESTKSTEEVTKDSLPASEHINIAVVSDDKKTCDDANVNTATVLKTNIEENSLEQPTELQHSTTVVEAPDIVKSKDTEVNEEECKGESKYETVVVSSDLPTDQSVATELDVRPDKQDVSEEAKDSDDDETPSNVATDDPSKEEKQEATNEKESTDQPSVWPSTYHDTFTSLGDTDAPWPNLSSSSSSSSPSSSSEHSQNQTESPLQWVLEHQQVVMRTVTWNMQARDPPPVLEVQKTLLPLNKYESLM
jgi:hypothetical protein